MLSGNNAMINEDGVKPYRMDNLAGTAPTEDLFLVVPEGDSLLIPTPYGKTSLGEVRGKRRL